MSDKPVLFTDLDRTLIFSKKFLKDDIDSTCIEKKGEKEISYMTKEALSLLNQVKQEVLFIPVSTRTWETMTRVDFVKEDMPEWMICDNGGHIYHKGQLLQEWEEIMVQASEKQQLSVMELAKTIEETFRECGLKEIFNRENLYLMVKFEEMTGEVRGMLEVLNISLRDAGYRIDINSRKAYLLPNFIRKERAVKFLMDKLNVGLTISAGDTLMDLEMLRVTDYAIAPKHKTFIDDFMEVTKQKGLLAGEETLHYIQHIARYSK